MKSTSPYFAPRVWIRMCLCLLLVGGSGGIFAATRTAAPLGGTAIQLNGGNFETPALPTSPGYAYSPSGSQWTWGGGAGLSRNFTAFTSGNPATSDGQQVLFLQGANSTATQTINFVAGYYTFQFNAAQRAGNTQTMQLLVDGVVWYSLTPSGTSYLNYKSPLYYISSGNHTVQLKGTNTYGGDNTVFIDDFRATRSTGNPVDGFETPVLPASPGFVYTPTGSAWTFTSGAGLSRNGTGFTAGNPNAPEGNQVLFLQGGGSASKAYYFAYPGFYRIRIKAALRGNNPTIPTAKRVRVNLGSYEVAEFEIPNSSYTEMASTVVYLSAGTYTISLTGVNPLAGDHTALVDDVRAELVHDWQDPTVWGGTLPGSADNAVIPVGSGVGMRGTINVTGITVNGELLAGQNQNITLGTKSMIVSGATALLEFGQLYAPYNNTATVTLNGVSTDPSVMGMGAKVLGGMNNSTVHIHGADKISWSQLGANANAGATTIVMKEAVNWKVGDQIVIVSSRTNWNEAEKRTITAISGTSITLNAALSYPHKGVVKTYTNGSKTWTADLRAQVGVLTHNIKIQGDAGSATSGFGGHMMYMMGSKAYISGVELYNMGQKAVLARYPMHWHMQGSAGAGQYFINSAVHQSFNRGITIHGTWSTLVENNFFYDHIGHGVFLEDGSEKLNVIKRNVVLLTKRPAPGEQLTPSDNERDEVQNRTPSSFWITNPENTYQDNVAAGTQGTGFWFALPIHPMGLSRTNPTFSGMSPYSSPMISFKGNMAHSCMSGFDIFDQLTDLTTYPSSPEHSIIPNAGWKNNPTHYMENCTWYANNLALYTGIGACSGCPSSNNLIFKNNVLIENVVGTMFASYSILDESCIVANSGEALYTGQKYAYRVYDGAGQVHNSRFIGWNASDANLFINTGAGIKHPNHIFKNNTSDHSGTPRLVLDNFDLQPQLNAHANHPGHPRFWAIVVRDLTGGISGAANTNIVSNHPFLLVGDEVKPSNWTNAYRSSHRFALSRVEYGSVTFDQASTHNVTVTREKAGTATEPVYYVNGYKEWHQLPLIVSENYEYTYQYEALPTTKYVRMNFDDATSGDFVVTRFKDFGKLGGFSISSSQGGFTSHSSLTNLRNSGSSGYYKQTNGDVYIKAVATGSSQYYTMTWSTNFSVPVIDTDGDQMSDANEIAGGRKAFEASDLAAEFSTASNFEGWTNQLNISGMNVSGGFLSGTGSGTGDAYFWNTEYNFRAQEVPHLFVRMAATSNTPVQIFFGTSTLPGFSGSRVVTANYTGAGAYQTLTFDMRGHANWQNLITDLRIDPVVSVGNYFQIDWIRAGCQGTDSDGDGVCDFADVCASMDDHLIGTSCNDGNAATFPDAWSAGCVCTGGSFKAGEIPAVADALSTVQVAVYPNPVRDALTIDLAQQGMFHTARLVDLQGRIVRETEINPDAFRVEWNFSGVPLVSGVYIVQLEGEGQRTHVKIVKE